MTRKSAVLWASLKPVREVKEVLPMAHFSVPSCPFGISV